MALGTAVIAHIRGVLCVGNVVCDILVWPAEDTEWNKTSWVDTISEGMGGNGANTSYTLAKLGVPVKLVSLVGADARAEMLTRILEDAGVDTSGIGRRQGGATSSTVVLVRNRGDRKFYHKPGASREITPETILFDRGASHFHLGNPFALAKIRPACGGLMRRAKEAGLTTSIDTGWDWQGRWMEELGPALPWTDLLFVNDAEEQMLGGSEALLKSGAQDIVVKTGPAGCIVNGVKIPGFRVDAVDSTGAGDCFAGAFLAGIHHGLSYIECARLANAVGAMNVERLGATTGVRSLADTRAWIDFHALS